MPDMNITGGDIVFRGNDELEVNITSTLENPDINVVMELGEPEEEYKGIIYLSSEAARQLAELSLTVIPANQTKGTIHEFGFFMLGKKTLSSFVVTEIVPVDQSSPTEVAEKRFTSDAFTKVAAYADKHNLEIVARGHDHHNVARPEPSAVDMNVFSRSGGTSRVEFIISRTTKPISVSAYYVDEHLQWNQMGGIEIVDDSVLAISGLSSNNQIFSPNGMSVEDNIKSIKRNLAYYDNRTGQCEYQNSSEEKVRVAFRAMKRNSDIPENIMSIEV